MQVRTFTSGPASIIMASNETSFVFLGGFVIDGTGRSPFRADVLVVGDKISEVRVPDSGTTSWLESMKAAGTCPTVNMFSCVWCSRSCKLTKRVGLVELIDISNNVICPGFIDTHTHDDNALLETPLLPQKTSQGVTSVVIGNCGLSLAPLVFQGTGQAPPPPLDELGTSGFRFQG